MISIRESSLNTGKKLKYGIAILLVFFMLFMLSTPALADAAETSETIRVGYMDYHGFIDKKKDGSYTGYAVDYLNKISEYTGYKYEYVFGEWSELLQKLENKQIDLICSAQYTAQRAERFELSSYPIGYTQGLLYTRKGNTKLCYGDFDAFDGMSVGILRQNAMGPLFVKYAAQHNFEYALKEFDTENEILSALNRGEIDAMCCEHLAYHTGLSLLANFGADAYYIMSYKGSPYMDDINYALQEIKTDVDFEASLFHKYYDNSTAASEIPFTREELEYIENAGVITVGVMTNRSPLSYVDEGGRVAGMIPDLMRLISEKSGLSFKYRFLELGQTGFDFLTSSGGDLVAGVAVSDFSTPNPALLQSETLQTASVVFVGRGGGRFDVNGKLTVALPAAFINGAEVVSAIYPSFDFYYGTTNEDCLRAIRDGRADVMLQNLYIIRECLQSPLYDGLEIFPAFSFPEDQRIVSLPENKLLISIINKSVGAITEDQQNDIVINNTIAKGYHANISEIMYKYRLPLVGIAVLIAAVIGMLISFSVIRQRSYHAIESVNSKLAEANAQLEDAVKQADRASTAKSQFLSRMSHEIRTPMNAIVGLTEIAKQHEHEPQKIDDYLEKIAVSSKVLLNIINDVLDMSAIESNKLKIANEEFDLKQVLGGISTIYYPQCQSKGIQLEMSTDVENEYLRGDSLRVSQILLNLTSNAYKFTPSGGIIKILVKETARKEDTAFIRFTVADTGSGMTDDMKSRLFKPFEQETANTAKKHGGSGLGLSIAKNLVDLMHGAISVESEKDEGTTFTVDLPFDVVQREARDSSKALSALRILAVDDDETAREYTATVLRRIGAPFEIASSGKQALEMVNEAFVSGKPYDVCLIDWIMPDMNGMELTKRIRSSQGHSSLIIIVTAFDLNELQDEAKSAGVDHFVSKPLFQSTVFDILMELTGGKITEGPQTSQSYDFTGHKVLLAEDQELNADIAIELLGMVNMKAERAVNGRAALDMFSAAAPGTYDAILMDVQMPEMDGYEAAAAIRALERPDAKTIPIFAMTANAFTEDIAAALSAGMNGHIAKPIDTKILYATLYDAIEKL